MNFANEDVVNFKGTNALAGIDNTKIAYVDAKNGRALIAHPKGYDANEIDFCTLNNEYKYVWVFLSDLTLSTEKSTLKRKVFESEEPNPDFAKAKSNSTEMDEVDKRAAANAKHYEESIPIIEEEIKIAMKNGVLFEKNQTIHIIASVPNDKNELEEKEIPLIPVDKNLANYLYNTPEVYKVVVARNNEAETSDELTDVVVSTDENLTFREKLISINGIGEKKADEIIALYPTVSEFTKFVKTGKSIPTINKDVMRKIRKAFDPKK